MILLIFGALRRTLDKELVDFFDKIGYPGPVPTKSAFSQARYKLSTHFFQDWNVCFRQAYYKNMQGELKKWCGWIVEAVDSSDIHLPDETFGSDIGRVFGVDQSCCMGLAVSCCDVMQNVINQAVLCPYKADERWVALRWLKNCRQGVLRLYDRGFASAALMYWHVKYKVPFVMRLKLDFNLVTKAFVESGQKEEVTLFKISYKARRLTRKGVPTPVGENVEVRLIRVELPNGEVEVLATSLYNSIHYLAEDFGVLYQKRWGCETIFDSLKNVLQLQLFAARRAKGLHQEFLATILLLNLQTIIAQDCKEEIVRKTKNRKYTYKINQNLAFGHIKDRLVHVFIHDEPEEILNSLKKLFLRQLIPIKPNRKVPRDKRKRHLNTKHCTPVNYRKAC